MLQIFCMVVTKSLYGGYKKFVWGLQNGLYGGYIMSVWELQTFIQGLQAFCIKVTDLLHVCYRPFVCRLQTSCYGGCRPLVCGLQTFGMWVAGGLYGDYRSFVLWLQSLTMTLTDLCMMVKTFKTM